MSRSAITVENLSKAYHIGLKQDRADTLMGAVQGLVRKPLAQLRHLRRMNTFKHQDDADDIYWALKDISFEVAEGEVVGIIGRNGAGKSTLLKILSRITEPTRGRAIIRGRVSSLLEVGTGFHQELSGRENVYMNGTILGMTKREIDRKFDEIVDFSGVEKFLDTPIKHYSSGMKVRLAFSVAAHLEPEILIVDEVLAVGDAEFQTKCLGKMRSVAQCGRTVFFVSHNLATMNSLCNRGILLVDGRIKMDATVSDVIATYRGTLQSQDTSIQHFTPVSRNGITIEHAFIRAESDDLVLELNCDVGSHFPKLGVGFEIQTFDGVSIATQGAIHSNAYFTNVRQRFNAVLRFPALISNLNGGPYLLAAWISAPGSEKLVTVEPSIVFTVPERDLYSNGRAIICRQNGPLMVRVEPQFSACASLEESVAI